MQMSILTTKIGMVKQYHLQSESTFIKWLAQIPIYKVQKSKTEKDADIKFKTYKNI